MRVLSTIMIGAAMFQMTSPAYAMTVNDFLPKAEKLMNAGGGAMFSKRKKPVMTEMKKVTTGYRAEIKASRAAGKKTTSCPPKKGSLKGKEFLSHLQSIPKAERTMQVKTAFHGFMAIKYPC